MNQSKSKYHRKSENRPFAFWFNEYIGGEKLRGVLDKETCVQTKELLGVNRKKIP